MHSRSLEPENKARKVSRLLRHENARAKTQPKQILEGLVRILRRRRGPVVRDARLDLEVPGSSRQLQGHALLFTK